MVYLFFLGRVYVHICPVSEVRGICVLAVDSLADRADNKDCRGAPRVSICHLSSLHAASPL